MTDIDHLLEIISDPCTLDIHGHWASFPLHEVKLQAKVLRNKPGVYAITDQNSRVLYVGKGKCIYKRLKSHKEVKENDRAEAWAQFFGHFNSNLMAYYFMTDKISSSNIEHANQAIERIVQIKHTPLFDQIYNTKSKPAKADFKGCLKECNYIYIQSGDLVSSDVPPNK